MEKTVIFGAPGCGKTTHLLNILEELLQIYEPNEIAFVSYTKAGSYEGRDRAIQRFGYKEDDMPYFRTIHSLAYRAMGMYKGDMIAPNDYKEFSHAMGMKFVGYYTPDFVHNDDAYLAYISLKRNNPHRAKDFPARILFDRAAHVEKYYELFKRERGVIDFDDLLSNYLSRGVTLPVKVAIIDEAQDLTPLQWAVCSKMFKDAEKVYIAGDDDQAIFEWSGADVGRFLAERKTASKIETLGKSFRMRRKIKDFAGGIAAKISVREDKSFAPVSEGGNIFFHNRLEDVNFNSEQSYFCLSRNRTFLKNYSDYFTGTGLPFTRYKKSMMPSSTLKHKIALYESLRKSAKETGTTLIKREKLESTGLFASLKAGFDIRQEWFESFNLPPEESMYIRKLLKNKADFEAEPKIHVNTIHGVKGAEADNVVLLTDATAAVCRAYSKSRETLDSELRVLYVGCTRAKQNLHIILSRNGNNFNNLLREEKSIQ